MLFLQVLPPKFTRSNEGRNGGNTIVVSSRDLIKHDKGRVATAAHDAPSAATLMYLAVWLLVMLSMLMLTGEPGLLLLQPWLWWLWRLLRCTCTGC